ncbi:MAG: UDP-N-acetylmuramoyl-L-alanyl-D-glutamate--2,6-diaminopimelate ligase [Synergistaceae bacterium]|jgi:UDP-N-acetylmuramoyl-L-alanyl-D-glutamate--2,6-diaminopimelate ligase|nr:UDP-N-acetylmuramoyl-L-alanyl-D-glutamate--2,6-diaminopimelate ligase [Synergistaceae bacterium]
MNVRELFDKLARSDKRLVNGDRAGGEIVRVEYDSRRVSGDGIIFACVKGGNTDGHDHAAQAVSRGAAALLCERELPIRVPQIITPKTRGTMGEAASVIYGKPSEKLKMTGVTGTNGKTTTAYITRSIIRASGARAGMIGTVVYDDAAGESFAERTTPEGPDIQTLLSEIVKNGASHCVMEASSHGLDQGRLEGCGFDAAGFSNLTPEHLEYHNDMENYFMAKRRLFSDYARGAWKGAVNAADAFGARLLAEFRENAMPFSAGSARTRQGAGSPDPLRFFYFHPADENKKINKGSRGSVPLRGAGRSPADSMYRIRVSREGLEGMTVALTYPDGSSFVADSPLVGRHNASNILESAVLGDALGFDGDTVKKGIENCPQVPGRLERYPMPNGVTVFVDFAHSEDGMEQALSTLKALAPGPVRVLWGAGGDRTPLKRLIVGEIMARLADHVVISTDNPRNENPADIARGVEEGVRRCARRVERDTILDRGEAIDFILNSARAGDVVLIAGKGPERFIDYGTRREPFVDGERVLEWARSHKSETETR